MAEPKGSVAVIGSGITGLSAAWLLQKSGSKVTLYEKDAKVGGHTLTDDSAKYPVDLGFQVFNYTTYPHFVGLLETLGVDSEASDMSFSLSVAGGALEWGSDPEAIFAQRKNLLSPSFWRMIVDVVRFGRNAPEVLAAGSAGTFDQMTLGEYLKRGRYSEFFIDNYILPMCAAVWSVSASTALAFPVVMLVRFWVNHHLLDVFQRPCWRVVKGRSRSYVERILQDLPDVSTGDAVTRVERLPGGRVAVHTASGSRREFDDVVLATHSDISLKLLGASARGPEKELLSKIPYSANDVLLHTDPSLMPKNKGAWMSWNCLEGPREAGAQAAPVCVSYWCNRLQNLPTDCPPTFVTLNPIHPPEKSHVLKRLTLEHPVFSFASVEAQAALPSVQGEGGVWFAGAWCGYGFHEDGIRAAVAVAERLGASIPWAPRVTTPKVTLYQSLVLSLFHKAAGMLKVGKLRVILPNGEERVYGSAAPGPEYTQGLFKRRELSAVLRVHDMNFFHRLVTRHDVGMGEAWMHHECESPDLGALLAVMTANAPHIEASRAEMGVLNWVGDKLLHLAHLRRDNTVEGSRKNIEEHYDAGNAMYKLFLDETMTYSAGIHKVDCLEKGDLQDAQFAKIDEILTRADVGAGDHVLEVGCGWGAFAMRAASTRGCRVTGITISKEQLAEATSRVKAAGLSHLVTLLFCDYRYSPVPGAGLYDKVVSVEMIEAVGHPHLPEYFQMIGSMLRPGGKAVIQAITEPDHRYELYCNSSDFIREHIFPGGHLPSMGAMVDAAQGTGLSVAAVLDIGPDYAVTLEEWRRRWMAEKDAIKRIGYDEVFHRKYEFYFAYCECAFEYKYIHDYIITWDKAATPAPGEAAGGEAGDAAAGRPYVVASKAVEREGRDEVTQVMCAVYFFLAGLMVGKQPGLWVVPATSLFYAVLFYVVGGLSKYMTRSLSHEQRGWWCAHAVSAVHSVGLGAAASAYAYRLHSEGRLGAVLRMEAGAAGPEGEALAYLLVCVSAGSLAFQLWTVVLHQLVRGAALPSVLHHIIMLCCLGGAAYKRQQVPFLALTLLAAVSDAGLFARKLLRMAGAAPKGAAYRACWAWTAATLPVLRVALHLGLTASLVAGGGGGPFSHWVHFAMALTGLLVSNVCNARLAVKLRAAFARDYPSPAASGKVHAN